MMSLMLRALVVAAALISAVGPTGAQVGKNVQALETVDKTATYLSSATLRDRGLKALFKAIGSTPPVSKIEIREDEITLWVQSPKAAHYTDEWTASRMKLLVFDRDTVTGPRPTEGDGIVARREGSFFDFEAIELERIEALVAEGTELAQMEERPRIAGLTIARRIGVLPAPHYGDVQITLSLSTERESATIYADADAQILGADLAGTSRAQRLDMIAEDHWPMADAQRRIAEVLGTKRLHELRVYDSYVFFEAEHPTKANTTRDYSWDLGGVTLGMDMEDHFSSMRDTAPFGMNEIDLSKLPDVKRAALAAFDSPGALITYIDADKPTDRAAGPQVLWSVDLKQVDGEEGRVLLDASANVVEVRLPESRVTATQGPWLASQTVAATLKRLEREFGPEARYGEILINDAQGSVLVEDPQAPGKMANFIIDPQSVTRFGEPMPWDAELDESRAFRIADVAALDAPTLQQLEQRTLERMKLQGAAVFRYTISKKMLMMSPDDKRLLVEVRAGKDDGWVSGWATYDLAGKEVDVMLP